MAFVGRALIALRPLSCASAGPAILEKLGVVAIPASRLLHNSQHCAGSDQLRHEGGFTIAPLFAAAQEETYEAVHQSKRSWSVLAACLTSFGVGALLGAEIHRRSSGAHVSAEGIHASSAWPSYTQAHLLPPAWPSSTSPSSFQNTSPSYLPLTTTTAQFLPQTPYLVHANFGRSRVQQSLGTGVSEELAQNDLQKELQLSPASVPGPLPEYLKSQEAARPLPAPAGSEPTSSTRPYLSANFIADAAAKASPAVVNITVSSGRGWLMSQSAGSGFIVDKDGTILTNAHVVAEMTGRERGAYRGKLLVTMQDGRTFEGKVMSFDTLSDIAVVKMESSTPLPFVKLGESANLRAGDWVVALGSPFHLMNTVTCGIVSCTQRKSSELGVLGGRTNYIQTDAAINQGNSGGPLVDLDGKVIGINTMKALSADGVSFAIPIDAARKVVEQLAKHGRVLRPFVGMKMLELNAAVISQLKERDSTFPDVSAGVLVPQVIPGSPAEKGGLMPGDVIVEFDGQSITTVSEILDALGERIGETIKVVVRRPRGKNATLSITTEEGGPPS
ncbi:Trypsin-like serine proteases domain containing protein [Klebsormidium nitens]|uniref:Trypsin-like serine proteases domain containing protein n=1 Tax=Klebsormidium nitens TaxID=105231 RepID=A0A1Y1HXF3_KLENI|nr:Trypsin-like serine proteases domain containing protein [Klebsormidium nitens]|eukprot:GAQ83340.1 Trypsin-like serine proteases domain containing protein [Klebsormidium nitens]